MSFRMDKPRPEVAEFVREMARQKQHFSVSAIMSCDCGCGQRGRVEMDLGQMTVVIENPLKVDELVSILTEARLHIWGPPPAK